MTKTLQQNNTSLLAFRMRVAICVVTLGIAYVCPASAKVLLQANFDGPTADADYAVGTSGARPVVANAYKVAGTVDVSRWGRALNVTDAGANCVYDGGRNFNPQRGTAELWFRVERHEAGMYHPLFGWYRPPHEPGAKKRLSAMEVYLHGSAMVVGLYTPKYTGHTKAAAMEVGKWHHLEVNWDCERGGGRSVYNIFLDGKSVIRVIDGGALADGEGGQLHLGVWDYGFGNILAGQIDEVKITDQVEHSRDFDPPTKPHSTPGTIEYARETYEVAARRLKQFNSEIESLTELAGVEGESAAAQIVRESQATANGVASELKSLASSLEADDPDATAVCAAVDKAADQLSAARLPIHRIFTKAAALAAEEDKRSLLFKDLNDTLAGDAIVLKGKQLFIDDYIIKEIVGARRVLTQPATRRVGVEPSWEKAKLESGSVMYDQQKRLFKTWYIARSADQKQQLLYYATSPNGIDWRRSKGQLPLTVGNGIAFYERDVRAQGWFKQHAVPRECDCLTTDRLDRFVAVDSTDDGTLTTRRFIVIGDTLVLNAKAAEGEIRVEAIDALGRVIKGFSKDDCKPIVSDNVRHVVSWKGDSNCHPLQARPIKLRFHLKRAKLYSFEFQIRHNHFVPTSYSQ